MLWNEVIELGLSTETLNNGEPIKTMTWTSVFCDKKSVGSKEFYNGDNLGFKPELIFVVRTQEYNRHEKVRYNSVIYDIIRTYVNGDITEITVTGSVGE